MIVTDVAQILVHGEKTNMLRLKSKLLSLNANKAVNQKTKVFSPANCEELRIPIRMDKTAKVVGKLAERIRVGELNGKGAIDEEMKKSKAELDGESSTPDGQIISGVLVQNDLKLSLMDPEDLREYAGLTTTTITCRQKITLASASVELIRWALEGTFGGIVDQSVTTIVSNGTSSLDRKKSRTDEEKAELDDDDEDFEPEEIEPADEEVKRVQHKFLVMDTVTVWYRDRGEIEVEWEGNMMNDGIADAVLAVLLTVESSPAAVKREFSRARLNSEFSC